MVRPCLKNEKIKWKLVYFVTMEIHVFTYDGIIVWYTHYKLKTW